MFGCCNNLFSNTCRCLRGNGCSSCGQQGATPTPIPVFPPIPTPTPTPPPTAPQLRGLEATLTAGSGGTVVDGFPIPFNNLISNNARGASFVTGSITLNKPGTYLVNWWVAPDISVAAAETDGQSSVAAQVAEEISFAVALNGQIVSGSCAPVGTGQITGSTLVTVTNTPATLQIVNDSGDNVVFATVSAQAGVTVIQFA